MSYEADILIWSEQQADLLRRAARGERPDGLDWENIAEEIESVGRIELCAVQSELRVALTHLLCLAHGTDQAPTADWAREVLAALCNAHCHFTPSMAQRIQLDQIWRQARRMAECMLRGKGMTLSPHLAVMPFTVAELVVEEPPDLDALVARLAG